MVKYTYKLKKLILYIFPFSTFVGVYIYSNTFTLIKNLEGIIMKKMYESTKFISAFISYIKVADIPVRRAIAEEPNTPV